MLSTMTVALLRFVSRFEREDGQALAEYGLILALIAVVCVALLTVLGLAIGVRVGGGVRSAGPRRRVCPLTLHPPQRLRAVRREHHQAAPSSLRIAARVGVVRDVIVSLGIISSGYIRL